VAYTVQMSDSVRTYLRTLSGLSREGRLKLLAGVPGQLRDQGHVIRSEYFAARVANLIALCEDLSLRSVYLLIKTFCRALRSLSISSDL
jgi:hypothetical protein